MVCSFVISTGFLYDGLLDLDTLKPSLLESSSAPG